MLLALSAEWEVVTLSNKLSKREISVLFHSDVDCHSELLILQVCLEVNGLETVQTVRVTIVTEVTKHFVLFQCSI